MKVDSIGKSLLVTETSAAYLDRLDSAINAFCRTIAYLQDNCIQYSPQVLLDGLGDVLDRFQATAYCPGQPLLPSLSGPCLADIVPE